MHIDRNDDTLIEVPRGLSNVAVAETAISHVDGRAGVYWYRGLSAVALAETASFEDVWQLLVIGELPDATSSAAFSRRVAALREAHDGASDPVDAVATAAASAADPLGVLAASLATLGGRMRPLYDLDEQQRLDDALAAVAIAPRVLGRAYRLRNGLPELPERPGLGFVADYLYRVTGREPSASAVRALTAYLIAAMDHGFNASTFTARVIASTGASMPACLVGALGALSGPLHGGAPARALDALDAVGTSERIEPWVRRRVLTGKRVMGFGHAVYRTADPRSRMLKAVAQSFGGPRVDLAVEYEQRVTALLAELKPGRELHANVEFYAAIVMELCGIPREMFTPTFAVARLVGWSAHVLEQARDPKIIRPSSRYVGVPFAA